MDKLGNPVTKTWSFSVTSPPKIEQATPADGSILKESPSVISAKVSDADGISASGIILQVDGINKPFNYDAGTGIVSWVPPAYPKDDTWHNVKLEVKDNRGEGTTKNWTFLVIDDDITAPRVSNIFPANGTTAKNSDTLSAKIVDYNGISVSSCTLTANDKPIPVSYNAIDSSSGRVTASLNGLASGTYTAKLTVVDSLGNTGTTTWSFTLQNCVVAQSVTPTGSIPLSSNVNINVQWTDVSNHNLSTEYRFIEVIDPNGAKTTYNGSSSPAVYAHNPSWVDEWSLETVYSYNQLEEGINLNLTIQGTYTVTAKARDTLGNESTKTWIFFAGSSPEITQQSPVNGTVFEDIPPVIVSAKVYDAEGIDPNSIILKVNNSNGSTPVVRNHSYDPFTGIVSWDSSTLTPGGLPFNVTLDVKDINGVPASSLWNFTVKNNPPAIDQQTPSNWSSSQNSPSVISARVSDKHGINPSTIKLTVDGIVRTHAFDPLTGIVSWRPETPLPLRPSAYPVKLEVKDNLGLNSISQWNFIVFGGSEVTQYSPQGDTYSYKPQISASFSDSYSLGNPSYIKIDGVNMAISINYPISGYSISGCESEPIFDYTKATVTANTSSLTDGPHTAEVMITNSLGMSKIFNWSFNVKAPPVVSDYPAEYSVTTNNQFLKLKILDPNGQVNPASIIIKGNAGSIIPHTYDPQTGIVIATPALPFFEGTQYISVQATDMAGNIGGKYDIKYNIFTDPPQFRFEGEGKTFYPGEPLDLTVNMKSFRTYIIRDKCSLKIDGNPVEAFISVENRDNRAASVFGGYAYCNNELKTAVGFIKYQGNLALSPGTHELTATATDANGNTNTQTWQFKVENAVISGVKPQGIIIDANPTVEAIIDSNQVSIDKQTIKMTIDKTTVEPQIAQENGLLRVTYTSAALANGEYHNVTLSANDINHFRHVKSWGFMASTDLYPAGLSKPTPANGAVTNNGFMPIMITANNADGTMDFSNAKMTFTHLTTNRTFEGMVDVIGFPSIQTIIGWYVVPAAFKADENRQIYLDPESKPGLDTPLEDGSWKVTATVPNKSNLNSPYTLTWNFTVGGGTTETAPAAAAVKSVKPSGATVTKRPTIMVEFTKDTILNNATQWVELLVDGQKIGENVISSTNSEQDGLANIYESPATVVYRPAIDLAEGTHSASARYYNPATGETISAKEWTFEVQTTNLGPTGGIMDIATTAGANKACTGCHGAVEKNVTTRFLHPLLNEGNWTDSACLNCHTYRTPWDRQLSGDNSAYADPNITYIYQSHPDPRVDCKRCHGQTGDNIIMTTHPTNEDCALCHKGDGTVVMIPDILNDSAMNMCTSCHYNVAPVNVTTNHNGAPEFNLSGRVSHNMDDGHLSATTGCASCHSRILTKEHAGKTDTAGNAITCNTCHDPSYKNEKLALTGISATLTKTTQVVQKIYYPPKGKRITSFRASSTGVNLGIYALIDGQWVSASYTMGYDNKVDGADALMIYGQVSRPGNRSASATLDTPVTLTITEVTLTSVESNKIWDAVVNGKTKCADCHTVGHTANHKFTSLDLKCQTCHSIDLMNEHLNNTTTAGKNYNCNTCHISTAKAVKRTINSNNLYCGGCHIDGHNLLFADKVPVDISLHNGFSWSTPIEASLYAGEPTTPVGYGEGQVVISSRRKDITIEAVWNFYKDQLTAGGWSLKSGQYIAGNQFFSVEYEKLGRSITVLCFNTEARDGTGPVESSGFRIELWYN